MDSNVDLQVTAVCCEHLDIKMPTASLGKGALKLWAGLQTCTTDALS